MVVQGTAYFTNGTLSMSDQTLKKDVINIDNALEKVLKLNGVYFNWIDTQRFKDKRQAGFIAQNVESVIPELVESNIDGIKSVNYSQCVSLLVEAMKEQNEIIQQLKKDIELLKNN
jgi:hypothetical protein